MNRKFMATKLRYKSDCLLQQAKKHPDAPIYYSDAGDMRFLADMIEEGRFGEALDFASNRDTAFREEIPADVWTFLTSENRERCAK